MMHFHLRFAFSYYYLQYCINNHAYLVFSCKLINFDYLYALYISSVCNIWLWRMHCMQFGSIKLCNLYTHWRDSSGNTLKTKNTQVTFWSPKTFICVSGLRGGLLFKHNTGKTALCESFTEHLIMMRDFKRHISSDIKFQKPRKLPQLYPVLRSSDIANGIWWQWSNRSLYVFAGCFCRTSRQVHVPWMRLRLRVSSKPVTATVMARSELTVWLAGGNLELFGCKCQVETDANYLFSCVPLQSSLPWLRHKMATNEHLLWWNNNAHIDLPVFIWI